MTPHDAAYKLLFSFPEMVHDLLAGFAPREWIEELDLSTLERWPGSHVSDDLRQRHQDRVWRVRFRGRWLYVLVLLEFQSTVDRTMAVRILAYAALLYQDLLRASSDALPPVFPIVLYHGRKPWTAPEAVSGLASPPGKFLAPYQPAQRYFLLNVRDHSGLSLPAGRNLVAALIRLERSRSMRDVEAVSDILNEWLSEPARQGLKRAFDEWIRQAIALAKVRGVEWPPVEKQSEEETMLLRETAREWPRQWMEEGRKEAHTQLMHRVAARKFDRATADRLAERLAEIDDSERMIEIGVWLFECESSEELLSQVERVSASLTT